MAGFGKYTTYVPSRDTKSGTKGTSDTSLLEKMYKGDSTTSPPFYGLTDAQAINSANSRGNQYLRAALDSKHIQQGDPGFFPKGVDMTYKTDSATGATISAPDQTKFVYKNPGDPANGYLPDITSPGPGKMEGTDKVTDSAVAKTLGAHIKPNLVPGTTPGTATPLNSSTGVYEKNLFPPVKK